MKKDNNKYYYYKRKISVLCVYNGTNYSIHALQFKTTSHHNLNFTFQYDCFTPHNNIQELIETIVKRANDNNYEIPYYDAFSAVWYDIDFIELGTAEIRQYGYLRKKRGNKK